ncbi:MAG: DUF393 domain-containing protein [Bacteroidetes bacterium]|nr:DUF393 domain-containing protein [Bacteroidota bacterium]
MSSADNIVFFDGVCNLCNSTVQWVIKRDKKKQFKFSSLQSDFAQNFIKDPIIRKTDSIVFYHQGNFYVKSRAVLKLLGLMRFPFNLAKIALIVPNFISDGVYDIVARNRYKWFGKRDVCMIPDQNTKDRFLE